MITPNVIESCAEQFAERYFKNFEGFTEKYGKELSEVVKMAFCDGYTAGANDLIRRTKKYFDELTTHQPHGICGQ